MIAMRTKPNEAKRIRCFRNDRLLMVTAESTKLDTGDLESGSFV